MRRLKSSAGNAGYDQEELYFFKKEQEIIKSNRAKSHLRLIQGEKKDSRDDLAKGSIHEASEVNKKAA